MAETELHKANLTAWLVMFLAAVIFLTYISMPKKFKVGDCIVLKSDIEESNNVESWEPKKEIFQVKILAVGKNKYIVKYKNNKTGLMAIAAISKYGNYVQVKCSN